jgi:regulatory protein
VGHSVAMGSRRRPRAKQDGPRGTAKDRALRLLGVRWRSREELRRRLGAAGFEPQDVELALEDLERVGLIDDRRFSRELVRDQTGRRLAGDRAVRQALRAKGVAPEVVEDALAAAGDELERATQFAARRAARMAGLQPEAVGRRLYGLLTRRGYGPETARQASAEALRQAAPGSAEALEEP